MSSLPLLVTVTRTVTVFSSNLPAPLADPCSSKLIKGIDEVGQIVDGSADKDEAEEQLFPRPVDALPLERRLDDERDGAPLRTSA